MLWCIPLILTGIKVNLLKPGDDLLTEIVSSMEAQRIRFEDGDILAIGSKVIAITQNRLVYLKSITPSKEASTLAEKYGLAPSYVEIVLQESKGVYGGVWRALLTLKDKLFIANAGVDFKNAPEGYVVLWPKNPQETAENIRRSIMERYGKRMGVLIVDSRVTPLRRGTIGVAIGVAGIQPVKDCRSETDLYGKKIHITTHALADDLASAAHLIMGETREQIPAVLIRGAPVEVIEEDDPEPIHMPPDECLYGHILITSKREN